MNPAIEQILLQLYDCLDYGISYRAKKGLHILSFFEHGKYDKNQIRNGIRDLNKEKLIKKKENYDGSVLISLTEKGRLRALNIKFRCLKNKKEEWDKKWRMVASDIPDECRKGRDALRYRLKVTGFYELQESIFLYPFNCKREIEEFVKIFKIEKYIHFGVLESIDNQDWLLKFFNLNN